MTDFNWIWCWWFLYFLSFYLSLSFSRVMFNAVYCCFFSIGNLGWQYRWFTVDAQSGILRYFLPTNNWSSSSTNNIATADTHSISSGNRSFDFDALSVSSGFNADSPTSNHTGTTPRWQVISSTT